MELSAAQQEHYARHLILDSFGGEGQERLLAASVRVRGQGDAALWAARYLAASGVGRLAVDAASWTAELRSLAPWSTVEADGGRGASAGWREVTPPDGSGPAESAANGAQAALALVRAVARGARE
jgi:hypothetical protein